MKYTASCLIEISLTEDSDDPKESNTSLRALVETDIIEYIHDEFKDPSCKIKAKVIRYYNPIPIPLE